MIAHLFRIFKGLRGFKNFSKKFEEISKKVLTNENGSAIIYTVSERETNLLKKKS